MTEQIRIGILNDMADAPPAPGDVTQRLEREIDAVQAAGYLVLRQWQGGTSVTEG